MQKLVKKHMHETWYQMEIGCHSDKNENKMNSYVNPCWNRRTREADARSLTPPPASLDYGTDPNPLGPPS